LPSAPQLAGELEVVQAENKTIASAYQQVCTTLIRAHHGLPHEYS
jgi:hypothetical protein